VEESEEEEEEKDAADGAFEGERREFFDAAQDEPQAEEQQRDGEDVDAPAEALREDAEDAADDVAPVGGEQAEEDEAAEEGEDDAQHVEFALGGEGIPPGGTGVARRFLPFGGGFARAGPALAGQDGLGTRTGWFTAGDGHGDQLSVISEQLAVSSFRACLSTRGKIIAQMVCFS
jgi:hypothetical protein